MVRPGHAAEAGDMIVIAGHHLGEPERIVEVLEVLGELPNERYRVRWDDGHESLYRPGSDATIRHATHGRSHGPRQRASRGAVRG